MSLAAFCTFVWISLLHPTAPPGVTFAERQVLVLIDPAVAGGPYRPLESLKPVRKVPPTRNRIQRRPLPMSEPVAPTASESYSLALYYTICYAAVLMSLAAFFTFVRVSLRQHTNPESDDRSASRRALGAAVLFLVMAALFASLDLIG